MMRLDDATQLSSSLASPAAEPAAGIALCTTGAIAAALITKACALSPDAGSRPSSRARTTCAPSCWPRPSATSRRSTQCSRRGATAATSARRGPSRALVLRDAAALLAETHFLADDVAKRCRPALRGEPLAAALLAAGAERAALALAEIDEAA